MDWMREMWWRLKSGLCRCDIVVVEVVQVSDR